ncbi:hypothetical protein NPIL_136531 [Nephila pilipes]|uniref:Uncharacterized protein n=1 Tax=Nephila pilipes TaxID=299642 RepID=A0A8X6TS20_NEPPI|nr:hypothetical protein NPIL_136531 [Nephila pilipes]
MHHSKPQGNFSHQKHEARKTPEDAGQEKQIQSDKADKRERDAKTAQLTRGEASKIRPVQRNAYLQELPRERGDAPRRVRGGHPQQSRYNQGT